jgi:hypothetical protein
MSMDPRVIALEAEAQITAGSRIFLVKKAVAGLVFKNTNLLC